EPLSPYTCDVTSSCFKQSKIVQSYNRVTANRQEIVMKTVDVSVPELVLVAGTRAMLGAGVGLLAADRLEQNQRRAIGWTLFAIGAISTIPLALEIFGRRNASA